MQVTGEEMQLPRCKGYRRIVTGTKRLELLKQLLAEEGLTLQEVKNTRRVYEASMSHMKQLAEIQDRKCQEIDTLKYSHCKRCGSTHSHPKESVSCWVKHIQHVDRRNTGQEFATTDKRTKEDTHKRINEKS